MRRTRQSFKETLKQALRRGLADMVLSIDEPPFQVEARPLGLRAGLDSALLNPFHDDPAVNAFLSATHHLQADTTAPW